MQMAVLSRIRAAASGGRTQEWAAHQSAKPKDPKGKTHANRMLQLEGTVLARLWEGTGGLGRRPAWNGKSRETKKFNNRAITRLSGRISPITMRQSKDLGEPDLPEPSNLSISECRPP